MMLDEDWEAIQDGMEFEARLKRRKEQEKCNTDVLFDDDNPDIGDDSD